MVPPKVEYSLTKRGKKAIAVVDIICNYGIELMKEFGVEHTLTAANKKPKKR